MADQGPPEDFVTPDHAGRLALRPSPPPITTNRQIRQQRAGRQLARQLTDAGDADPSAATDASGRDLVDYTTPERAGRLVPPRTPMNENVLRKMQKRVNKGMNMATSELHDAATSSQESAGRGNFQKAMSTAINDNKSMNIFDIDLGAGSSHGTVIDFDTPGHGTPAETREK